MMRQFNLHLSKIIATLLGLVIILSFRHLEQPRLNAFEVIEAVDLKRAALIVLQAKCNVCHKKKNPRKVFNLENMSELAPKIHKQVFIKKRMPKGNKIRLTNEEYNTLKNWLLTEKIF